MGLAEQKGRRKLRKRKLLLSVSLLACVASLQQLSLRVDAKHFAKFAIVESHSQDQSNADYRIQPKDLLDINIEGVCIFNPTFEVDDRGMIKMPIIYEVRAAGKTAAELENEIVTKLNQYLKNPEVHVRLLKRRT